jgi:hypothetical protein
MILFLNLLTVGLLALVAGLLLAVGQQVRVWRKAMAESPLLAEQLAAQLLAARNGLEDLRKGVLGQGPELSRLLSEGGKLRTELQFLLEKADQSAARLDLQMDKKTNGTAAKMPKASGSIIEQVAGANGHSVQPSHRTADPLEELLAGLQAPLIGPESKSARRGPVTQAELSLQQSIAQPSTPKAGRV